LLPNPLSQFRQIVDNTGKPTQLMQLYTEQLKAWGYAPNITGNITFDGTSQFIYGDFTTTSRVMVQSNVTNGQTFWAVMPNGTSNSSGFSAFNSSTTSSSAVAVLRADLTVATLSSTRTGAAPYVPWQIATGGASRIEIDTTGNIKPLADNAYTNGGAGLRWSAVWAANGTIQTSDIRTKTDVEDCILGLDFINYLEPISYKFIEGGNDVTPGETEADDPIITPRAGVRTHWGFSAQHIKQIADIFAIDFGAHVLADINDPDSLQGLRMDQFIAPVVKAIQEISIKQDEIIARLEALEND
jgi:hypothetical protein